MAMRLAARRATVSPSKKAVATSPPNAKFTRMTAPRFPQTPASFSLRTRRCRIAEFGVALALTLFFGALAPAEEKPWSFAPITKPAPPRVSDLKWCRDGVDVFVLAKLDAHKLTPNSDADRG